MQSFIDIVFKAKIALHLGFKYHGDRMGINLQKYFKM